MDILCIVKDVNIFKLQGFNKGKKNLRFLFCYLGDFKYERKMEQLGLKEGIRIKRELENIKIKWPSKVKSCLKEEHPIVKIIWPPQIRSCIEL